MDNEVFRVGTIVDKYGVVGGCIVDGVLNVGVVAWSIATNIEDGVRE